MPKRDREYTVVIPGETPPSWNALYAGRHWSFRSQLKNRWHELVWQCCKEQRIPRQNGTIDLTIIAYFKNARCLQDADNLCAKVVNDGLKLAVLTDDSPAYVRKVTTESRIDRSNPRTEIIITPAE